MLHLLAIGLLHDWLHGLLTAWYSSPMSTRHGVQLLPRAGVREVGLLICALIAATASLPSSG